LKTLSGINLHLALIHYPVLNKKGETVASAITNLDLHDIARAARTFGARALHVITPLEDQRKLAEKIVRHWTRGPGGVHNPHRREALELIRVAASLEETRSGIAGEYGRAPVVVATCARRIPKATGFGELAQQLQGGAPHLVIFGTAWGLAQEVIEASDVILEPIGDDEGYNHLSVRCAAAIVLDRLMMFRQ
jgi:hypothetical protein